MTGEKRKQHDSGNRGTRDDSERSRKRRMYAAQTKGKGGGQTSYGQIGGPGLWFSCVRRKEAKSTGEAYDLLNEVADRIYPETSKHAQRDAADAENDDETGTAGTADPDDIEAQIARELEEMRPGSSSAGNPQAGPRRAPRFKGARTDTECLLWISCTPPCDPVQLCYAIVEDFKNGAPLRSKYLQRVTPVSDTTHADPNSLKSLAYKILQPVFAPLDYNLDKRMADEPIRYRIEPVLRNHTNKLNRQIVMDIVGEVVRDLANPSFQFTKRKHLEEVADPQVESAVQDTAEAGEANKDTKDGAKGLLEDSEQSQPELIDESDASHVENAKVSADQQDKRWTDLPTHRRRAIVDLKHATHTIIVSALKGTCGMSIVEGYEEGKKFNIQSLAGATNTAPSEKAKTGKGTADGDENAVLDTSTAQDTETEHLSQAKDEQASLDQT